MARPVVTVGEIVESVSFQLINTITPDSSLASEIRKNIGYVMQVMIQKSDMPAFRVEATLSLVDGTSDYDLPDDFESIVEPGVYYDTSPRYTLRYYREQDRIDWGLQEQLSSKQQPYHYTIRNRDSTSGDWQIRFVATPDASYTVRYTYFASPTPVVGTTSDATEIDTRFPTALSQGIVSGVIASMGANFIDVNMVQLHEAKFNQAMSDMRRNQDPVTGNTNQTERWKGGRESRDNDTWHDTIYTGSPLR